VPLLTVCLSVVLAMPCQPIVLSLPLTFLWLCRPAYLLSFLQAKPRQQCIALFLSLHCCQCKQEFTGGLFFMSKKEDKGTVYMSLPTYYSIYETNQSEWLSFCLLPAVVLFSGTEQQNHATTWSSSSCRPIHHLVLLM